MKEEVELGGRRGRISKSYSTYGCDGQYRLGVARKRKKKTDEREWIHVNLSQDDQWILPCMEAIAKAKERSVAFCAREAFKDYINKNPAPQVTALVGDALRQER